MLISIAHLFVDYLKDQTSRPFLVTKDSQVSTLEFAHKVYALYGVLKQSGLKAGDTIVTYTEDTHALLPFYFACAMARVLPAPISTKFSVLYLRSAIEKANSKYVYTDQENFAPWMLDSYQVIMHDPTDRTVWATEGPGLAAVIAEFETQVSAIKSNDPFMIQPTSGSSGTPKLVLRPHQAFVRYAQFVGDQVIEAGAKDPRMLMVATLLHAYGLHMLTTGLRLRATFAIPSTLDVAVHLDEVMALEPTILPLLPRISRSLMRQHEKSPRHYYSEQVGKKGALDHIFGPSAKIILSAGGAGDPDIYERFKADGLTVMEFYGSSEASLIALTPLGKWKPRLCGVPVPDIELKFDKDCEILIKSPGLMLGYCGEPQQTAEAMTADGFYRSGDLGRLSPEGYLEIFGRKRDVFNTFEGTNIFPERIETKLESFEWVHQAMLIGDSKPFCSAVIVIEPKHRFLNEDDSIDEAKFQVIMKIATEEIRRMNGELEALEKVLNFVLVNAPFPSSVYKTVGGSKIARDRKKFLELFDKEVKWLYSAREIDLRKVA